MPLDTRVVSINFGMGLDQKTDGKLTTKLTTADNCVLRKNGTIEKRLGFVANGTWSVSANPVKVFPFNDDVVVTTDWSTDTSNIYTAGSTYTENTKVQNSLANVGGKWTVQSIYPFSIMTSRAIFSSPVSVGQLAFSIINGSATQSGIGVCYAALSSINATAAQLSFMDIDTESSIRTPSDIVNSKAKNRLTSLSTTSLTAYAANCSGTIFRISSFTSGSLTVNLVYSVTLSGLPSSGDNKADLTSIGSKVYFTYQNIGTTQIFVGSIDSAGTSATAMITHSVTPEMLTIVEPQSGTDRLRIIWGSSVTGLVYTASFSLTLSTILSTTVLTPSFIPTGTYIQLEGVENVGLTTMSLFATKSTTVNSVQFLGTWSNTSATFLDHVGGSQLGTMATKPFLAHEQPHILMNSIQTASQSLLLMRMGGNAINGSAGGMNGMVPVARCFYGTSPQSVASNEWLPRVIKYDNDNFYTINRRATFFKSVGTSITSTFGSDLININFCQTYPVPFVQTPDATYVGGGFLSEYDGGGFTELGFLGAPSIVTVSVTTVGGSLGASAGSATYSVRPVMEYIDEAGKIHRSQPGQAYSFNVSTSTSKATMTMIEPVNFRDLTRTVPGSVFAQSRFVAFRTTNAGSIYYRDPSIQNNSAWSDTSNTMSVTATDTVLSGGDVLYTQGGSLPNFTPDGVRAMCLHKNRIICNDPTNRSIGIYSKLIVTGEGVAFSPSNQINIPGIGDISAFASLDGTLISFRARSICATGGDGPDDTGLNGSFGDGQILFSDIGCIDQRNLCRFRDGIIFKSQDKGFYMLSRDFQISYVGADVEAYNSKTVVSSEVVGLSEVDGSAEECRFLCSDGTLLTYNYYNGQWTTATLSGCVDAVQSGGRYIVVNTSTTVSGARVFQQSMTTYLDAFSNTSQTYQMSVETGWIKTADVQGFQRIWKANVIGEAVGAGDMSVEVGYDYETAYNESYTVSMSSITAANYTGGATAPMQGELAPVRQKCQAIRFRIKDYPGATGVVFKLTNLSLECGVKSGLFKLPASKGI